MRNKVSANSKAGQTLAAAAPVSPFHKQREYTFCQQISYFGHSISAKLSRNSPSAKRFPLRKSAQQRGEKGDKSTGGFDRAQQPDKMSSSRPDRASDLGKERWRSTRRQPATVTSEDPSLEHTGASFIGRGRGGRPIPSSSGKLLSVPLSPSSLRIVFCARGARAGTGNPRSHRHKTNDEG